MKYETISIKEAVNNVNGNSNGWFLPAVQRPYVWGSRYESEKYICRLFDSILNGYPIGIIIVWNTDLKIPYREFIHNYADGDTAKLVDEGLWDRADKYLVYDGQQRLQTLYSCLKYSINNRVLAYNLLAEDDENDDDFCNFKFFDKDEKMPRGYIKLLTLFSKQSSEKTNYRKDLNRSFGIAEAEEEKFEKKYDGIWDTFVGDNTKSLAYFVIDKNYGEDKVNDIFQRLNTGGVPLSGADLLFSKIKETEPSFEEKLSEVSKWISEVTNGYFFSPNEILQLINLIVKGTIRIDASKINDKDIKEFKNVSNSIGEVLKDFFGEFIYKQFKIKNNAIISRKTALLPLMVYLYKKLDDNIKFLKLSKEEVLLMKQYFILSQLNDWNTQGIIEGCTREIKNTGVINIEKFKEIAKSKNRSTELTAETFENNRWFSLKIMVPNREFIKQTTSTGRFKPELDHIFPMKPKHKVDDYDVDTLWNLQPVSGTTNLDKTNKDPHDFFSNQNTSIHIDEYDFLPNINSDEWEDHKRFIAKRKERMIEFVKNTYELNVKD